AARTGKQGNDRQHGPSRGIGWPAGSGHRRLKDHPPHRRDPAKREGCEVVTASDGFEALAKIADQQPQIIFVDVMVPRLDGYQTCALIKGNQKFKSTPVIMLSSKDGLFDKARGRIVGSEQYLTKPFTREELLGAIRTYVNA